MYSSVPRDTPWNAVNARDWDQMTFEKFICASCWTELERLLGARLTNDIFACEPYEVILQATCLVYFLYLFF